MVITITNCKQVLTHKIYLIFIFCLYSRNLSSNELVAVTDLDGLSRLSNLRAVDFSHNDIACVEDGALWGLQNLRYM